MKQEINFNSINIQYTTTNLTNIKNISFTGGIYSISICPSGNKIIANYKSLIIYDNYFNIIIQINNSVHNNLITYVVNYDENNFVTCSYDNTIKTWIKSNNEYINNKIINNAHDKYIYQVIYNSKVN